MHCSDCGETVVWATVRDTGERIPLNERATELTGDDRYVFVEHNPPTVQAVSPTYRAHAYADHRVKCPLTMREARL